MPAAKSTPAKPAQPKPAAKPATRSADRKPAKPAKPAKAKSATKPAKSAKARPAAKSAEAKPTKPAKPKAKPAGSPLARPLTPTAAGAHCWLVKSEPDVFSIDHLARDGKTAWEGVRNYQARNHMRDDMKVGDPVLFYHSNADPPAIVGLARVACAPYADPTQFDDKSDYFDPKATRDEPRWMLVDLAFVEKFPTPITLDQLRSDPALAGMYVAKKAHRPSVQPVEPWHLLHVAELGRSSKARAMVNP